MGDTMATQEAYVQVKDLKKHYGDGDARLTVLDGILIGTITIIFIISPCRGIENDFLI